MINFLGLSGRTAAIVRGQQVSSRIEGAEFIDVNHGKIGKNRISLMIRNCFMDAVALNKRHGKLMGYDVADMLVGDVFFRKSKNLHLKHYHNDFFDFYVVNNDVCVSELREATEKPIFVIPHHSVNFENKKISVKENVKRIGYVGLPEQLSQSAKIQNFCKQANVEFVSIHPTSREDCDKVFTTLDIGIIFIDDTTHAQDLMEVTKKYKPNVKLTNFQSYGIPTVCVEYESYKQFGGNHYVKTSENVDELLTKLEILTQDYQKRFELSECSFEHAQKFHIDSVVDQYKNMKQNLDIYYNS